MTLRNGIDNGVTAAQAARDAMNKLLASRDIKLAKRERPRGQKASSIATYTKLTQAKRKRSSSDDAWRAIAYQSVEHVCFIMQTFTADDVWSEFGSRYRHAGSVDGRALGGIILRAQRSGLCKATAKTRKTARPSSRKRPLTVWFSNAYTKSGAARALASRK